MFKNTYLSFYFYNRGQGKVTEIMSTSGKGRSVDLEIEKDESAFVNLILETKRDVFAKLKKGKHYFICLTGDFLKTKVRNIQDFEVVEMSNFKQDEKAFKVQLKKDSKDDQP